MQGSSSASASGSGWTNENGFHPMEFGRQDGDNNGWKTIWTPMVEDVKDDTWTTFNDGHHHHRNNNRRCLVSGSNLETYPAPQGFDLRNLLETYGAKISAQTPMEIQQNLHLLTSNKNNHANSGVDNIQQGWGTGRRYSNNSQSSSSWGEAFGFNNSGDASTSFSGSFGSGSGSRTRSGSSGSYATALESPSVATQPLPCLFKKNNTYVPSCASRSGTSTSSSRKHGSNREDAQDFARRYGITDDLKPTLNYRMRKGKYRKEF